MMDCPCVLCVAVRSKRDKMAKQIRKSPSLILDDITPMKCVCCFRG